ncbi:MAG TPA: hypothetical protein VH062_33930 [Polyangiaceae bacterium]|jgi:hypothetical protein|nr:hypothetical protein [Polyangiaceae bacterium]
MAVFAAVFTLSGLPRPAHAQSVASERPIRVQYTAHEGCPDALGFFWYVRARTQRVRLAAEGEPADLATVQIVQTDGQSVGTLELPPVEGRPFSRQVEAASCNDVVLALSLVVALNYDPDATTTFPTVVTAPPVEAPAVAPSPPPVVAPPPPFVEQPLAEAPRRQGSAGASAGLTALGYGGVAPGLNPVLAPFFEYGSNEERLLRPSVRAAVLVQVPSRSVTTTAGNASLFFVAGQLSGCPISVRIVDGVGVAPCLAFDLGKVLGTGGGQGGQSGSLWWATVEAVARLRSALGGPLFAEVTGGGGIQLAPGEFDVFAADGVSKVRVYKLPTGFGFFGLALGVHFP